MMMWRREERREMIAWLLCKHQTGHECIVVVGPNRKCCEKEYEREDILETSMRQLIV